MGCLKIAFGILLLELLIFPLDFILMSSLQNERVNKLFWAQICLDEADNFVDNYKCFLISIYLDVQKVSRFCLSILNKNAV